MITVTAYKGQPVGVFGLGIVGEATMKALTAGGATVWTWDDKAVANQGSETHIHHSKWPWKKLKALVLSPGVPLTHPNPHEVVAMAKQHGVPIIGDIELLYQAQPDARYVGITGTNGKSTTTSLIAHILQSAGLSVGGWQSWHGGAGIRTAR
jgi:UDP-N-acetylmuramoylalanine--D-glutamate ligase